MDWRKLILAYFYSMIRSTVSQVLGGMFTGIPVDLVMIAIGWYKSKEWWGETLAISGATMLGATSGLSLGGLFGGGQAQATGLALTPPTPQPQQTPKPPTGGGAPPTTPKIPTPVLMKYTNVLR